jgi:hypothetical protein
MAYYDAKWHRKCRENYEIQECPFECFWDGWTKGDHPQKGNEQEDSDDGTGFVFLFDIYIVSHNSRKSELLIKFKKRRA